MIWSVLLKPRCLCWDCSGHLVLPEHHPFCFAFDTASPVSCICCQDKIIILLSPFLLFSCSQCEVSMRVRRAAAYQKYVMGCKWEAAVHALRCDMKAPSQLKSSAGPCKAQGNEPAAASSTVGPWFTGIFSFNYVLIYKFHAFFPGCLIVKE